MECWVFCTYVPFWMSFCCFVLLVLNNYFTLLKEKKTQNIIAKPASNMSGLKTKQIEAGQGRSSV